MNLNQPPVPLLKMAVVWAFHVMIVLIGLGWVATQEVRVAVVPVENSTPSVAPIPETITEPVAPIQTIVLKTIPTEVVKPLEPFIPSAPRPIFINGRITLFVADTKGFRDQVQDWTRVLQSLLKSEGLKGTFGTPPIRIVDGLGVRGWDGRSLPPESRATLRNDAWQSILTKLEAGSVDGAERMMWIVDTDKNPDFDVSDLKPARFDKNHTLTLLWSGYTLESNSLKEFSRQKPATDSTAAADSIATIQQSDRLNCQRTHTLI